jgi:hypothetical protein
MWYNVGMSFKMSSPVLDRLLDPLSQCLTPESAKRLLKFRADRQLQALVDRLAEKCNEGTLTPEEQAEYASYVSFGTFVALLKSKARQLLAESSGV